MNTRCPKPITTTTPPTTTTTTSTPTTTPRCRADMATILELNFVNYSNPTDLKASGRRCEDSPGAAADDRCDLRFEVCVTEQGVVNFG